MSEGEGWDVGEYGKVEGHFFAYFVDPGVEACFFVRVDLVGEGCCGDGGGGESEEDGEEQGKEGAEGS